jgi:hypothetical protein
MAEASQRLLAPPQRLLGASYFHPFACQLSTVLA